MTLRLTISTSKIAVYFGIRQVKKFEYMNLNIFENTISRAARGDPERVSP